MKAVVFWFLRFFEMVIDRLGDRFLAQFVSGGLVIACFAGCGGSEPVQVVLKADPSREHNPGRLVIQAKVSGPQERLNYRWFSETGECIPQRSDSPETVFSFGEGKSTDRIVVEVW